MKQLWKDILAAVLMGMVLPGLVVNGTVLILESRAQETLQQTSTEPSGWTVQVRFGETVREMDMDAYLVGVLLAEMPGSFETEALKAQAVAARTYAEKAALTGGKHGDGSVCMDSACCQGYRSGEGYSENGGPLETLEKVKLAVADTGGLVLTYDGELIEATYFSCSGGMTEDAQAVWGTEVPYLQSVSSPEEKAQRYAQTLRFTPEEFQQRLGRQLPGSPESWFTVTTYTQGGGVAAMTVGGEVFTGTELRALLGLRSTAFTVDACSDRVEITTRGYGHRVGLSQYGADAMAAEGYGFQEILAHYYPGTELVRLSLDKNGGPAYFEINIQLPVVDN